MKPRMLALSLAAALVAAVSASPVRAGDAPDPDLARAKASVKYFDDYAPKAKDVGKFAELVAQLTDVSHVVTVERVARILMRDPDPEHQLIAASTLGDFKKPKQVQEAAGKALLVWLEKGDGEADLKDTVVHSIGQFLYKDAVPKLNEILLQGGDPYVLLTTVRVTGELNDRRSLPALLELWERTPVGYKWSTGGEVKVDTGASGGEDQAAAEASWHAANDSKMKHHKKPPVMFKLYIQKLIEVVRKITVDDTIEFPNDLRTWMESRREELKKEGIDIPKFKGPTKKDDGKDGKDGKDKKGKEKETDKDKKDGTKDKSGGGEKEKGKTAGGDKDKGGKGSGDGGGKGGKDGGGDKGGKGSGDESGTGGKGGKGGKDSGGGKGKKS